MTRSTLGRVVRAVVQVHVHVRLLSLLIEVSSGVTDGDGRAREVRR
jgi:hypothetical protein